MSSRPAATASPKPRTASRLTTVTTSITTRDPAHRVGQTPGRPGYLMSTWISPTGSWVLACLGTVTTPLVLLMVQVTAQ